MNGPSALSGFESRDARSLIDARAALRGAHPFLIWQPFDAPERTWSYAGFRHAVRRFAAGLHARGMRPGQRLLIHSDNCPEFMIAWLGCAYAGGSRSRRTPAPPRTSSPTTRGTAAPWRRSRSRASPRCCRLPPRSLRGSPSARRMAGRPATPLPSRSRRSMATASDLAPFKQPHEVRVVESLPRATLDKIAKAELRRLLASESGASEARPC